MCCQRARVRLWRQKAVDELVESLELNDSGFEKILTVLMKAGALDPLLPPAIMVPEPAY